MWKYLIISFLVVISACTGTKGNPDTSVMDDTKNGAACAADIHGQWDIENVVENDSIYVRPSDIKPLITAYIDFKEDNTFGIMTNCNHIGGRYYLNNDSIRLTDISTTEIACDNMEVEDMLKKIMPMVNVIDCINDSVIRLNSDKGDSYIVLKKKNITLK